jgi:O-succinylbenzoic acid--CoA ligase
MLSTNNLHIDNEADRPFRVLDNSADARELVQEVFHADTNALLIPPRFEELKLSIGNPKDQQVNIGLFSSGSTGKPKCIWNSRQNLLLNAELSREKFEIGSTDRLLIIASPWHVAGLTWALMAELAGVEYQMVIPRTKDSNKWASILREFEPTRLFTVPTVLRYLVQDDDWCCHNITYGGAPIEPEMYSQLQSHTSYLTQAYGQTEAGGLIAAYERSMEQNPYEYESICCGTPPRGEMVQCDSHSFDQPAPIKILSQTSINREWYDTGDMGYINDAGDLHITGRKEKKHGNCNMISAVTSVAHK